MHVSITRYGTRTAGVGLHSVQLSEENANNATGCAGVDAGLRRKLYPLYKTQHMCVLMYHRILCPPT